MKKIITTGILYFFCLVLVAAQDQTIGLFKNDPGSFDGYTLFASNGYTSTYLIDNCGRLINEWPGEYLPGNAYYLTADGFLYRSVALSSNTFSGGGIGGRLEKLDWEGNIVWEYNYSSNVYHQHHDIVVLPDGDVLFLAWEKKTIAESIAEGRNPDLIGQELWPDHIIEVRPIGAEGGAVQWEWHLWDHLIQDFDSSKNNFGIISDHPELIDINYIGSPDNTTERDWTHCNSIAYDANRDEIVISSREFNEFWIIDHSTSSAEATSHSGGNAGRGGDILYRWGNPLAYQRGTIEDQKLFSQHDVHWIPEGIVDAGKIMCFNNGNDRPGGDASSVDVLIPPLNSDGSYLLENGMAYGPESVDWTYFPDPSSEFYSSFISGAQRLPNGNTLICEGGDGRIFEVNESEDIVWEYICPVGLIGPVAQGQLTQGNTVFRSYRYPVNYSAFGGKDLTPGAVIELDPPPSDCEIMTSINLVDEKEWTIFPNPVDYQLTISTAYGEIGSLKIVDALGQLIYTSEIKASEFIFPTIKLQEGIYFLLLPEGKVEKFVCQH